MEKKKMVTRGNRSEQTTNQSIEKRRKDVQCSDKATSEAEWAVKPT